MENPTEDSSEWGFLSAYADAIAETDIIEESEINPILQGLFGEVGGIMSTAKKFVREQDAYPGFRSAAEEEFGDTLWYLAAVCRRQNISLERLFSDAQGRGSKIAPIRSADQRPTAAIDSTLFNLGRSAAGLLESAPNRSRIEDFASDYLHAIAAAGLNFTEVARENIAKARGAFVTPRNEDLLNFDSQFGVEEQLPNTFKIRINQRESGRSYLQWNEVFIGDPLSDNISDQDGYRFHDVFHLAHAAILHWSPVMRALIKHKRKSLPDFDEAQDGGRAIVVEEGLTAWVFSRAKELNYFEGQERISLGILKTVREFVAGYEVDQCPLKLWERAILDGYAVFRQIRDAEGGWVVGNRALRKIHYEPLEGLQ